MPIKCIGQFALASATETTIIDGTQTAPLKVSLNICERGGAAATLRLRLSLSGATDDNKQFLLYDYPINANDAPELYRGGTLGIFPRDLLKIRASTANITVTLFDNQ